MTTHVTAEKSEAVDGEYFIKVKFKTMAEMHDAYGAMADLAKVAEPLSRASLPNTTGEAE